MPGGCIWEPGRGLVPPSHSTPPVGAPCVALRPACSRFGRAENPAAAHRHAPIRTRIPPAQVGGHPPDTQGVGRGAQLIRPANGGTEPEGNDSSIRGARMPKP